MRVFGYSSDEAVGQTLDLIVPPGFQALHWRGFNRAVASGQLKRPGKTLRVPAVHKSGKIISLQIDDAALMRDSDGTVSEVAVMPSRGPAWVAAVSRAHLAAGLRFSGSSKPWATCKSPKRYSGLSDGRHTSRVRDRDLAGNTDPSPAKRSFRVDPN